MSAMKPTMMTAPSRRGKIRCRYCNDTLHWLGAGWGHDKDNMACCMDEIERVGRVVTAEPKQAIPSPSVTVDRSVMTPENRGHPSHNWPYDASPEPGRSDR